MKFFRSNITRFASTCLLVAGMLFYFINPKEDKIEHEAFTSWLQSNLKTQDDSAVLDQIHELSDLNEELESVIRKASILVQNHSGNFNLPINSHSDDQNTIYRVLISEWNAFQNTTSGMGKAVILTNAKAYSVLPTDGLSFHGKAFIPQHQIIRLAEAKTIAEPLAIVDYHTAPLSGGIAIGAP